ncbi:MAG: hypothetical protein LBD81_00605 [Holosporaceae bacterium]|jgi:putative ABC transport system permease protein|nr:hypothetical protein [Holosporaceae bacterium]
MFLFLERNMEVLDHLLDIFSLSLAFSLIGLNVFLTSNVMKVTDMSCDGSVALGGCSYGALVVSGFNPALAFIIAVFLGAAVGFVTSLLSNKLQLDTVIASIVTVTALGAGLVGICSTIKIDEQECIKLLHGSFSVIDILLLAFVVVIFLSYVFHRILHSEYGLGMRIFGDGEIISESLGIDSPKMLLVALCLGNAFSAAAGALVAQITGVFNAGMGSGAMVFGITSIIIGEKIFQPKTLDAAIYGCILSSVFYKLLVAATVYAIVGTKLGGSVYDSLVTAVILVVVMLFVNIKKFSFSAKGRSHD